MVATASLLKLLNPGPALARRTPSIMRMLVTGAPGAPGSFEGTDSQMKESAGPMESVATETRGMASSSAAVEIEDEIEEKTNEMVGKAENMTDKAKQTVQDVWGSAKETAQKVRETVVGKAENARDFIKETAEEGKEKISSAAEVGGNRTKAGIECVKAEAYNTADKCKETVSKAMNTKET